MTSLARTKFAVQGHHLSKQNMKIQPLIYQGVQAPLAAGNELTDSACNPPTCFSPQNHEPIQVPDFWWPEEVQEKYED